MSDLITSIAGMTLGQAMDRLHVEQEWACACMGGPLCCIKVYRRAEALQRGAHIVAKLLTDAATSPHRRLDLTADRTNAG